MGNKALDTTIFDKAAQFAIKAHAGIERRGKGFPYIIHPMEAAEIAATISNDPEILAAAMLHDVVEDTDYTIDDIRKEFSERIAALVESESDKSSGSVSEKDSWISRKIDAINRLASAPIDAKIVAMGDKLSNMRAIARDYDTIGDEIWKIFHQSDKRLHEWHYRGLAESLKELSGTFAYNEFTALIDHVFGNEDNPFIAKLIDMADYEQSGDGFTAISYNHKDGSKMIKLYNCFSPSDAPFREKLINDAIAVLGIKCPVADRIVTDGSRYGVKFERINPKKSFARAISEHPEDVERYAVEFARECKAFHDIECDTNTFTSVKDRFIGAIEKTAFFNDSEKAVMKKFVNNVPESTKCSHGDMHIGNIVTDGQQTWWIDLADFHYGHPDFDLGMIYLTCNLNPEHLTEIMFHTNNEVVGRFWKFFVREYFPYENIEDVNKRLEPFAALMLVYFTSRGRCTPDMEDLIRKALL